MITSWTIWAIGICDSLKSGIRSLCVFLAVCTAVGFFTTVVAYLSRTDEDKEECKLSKRIFIFSMCMFAMFFFLKLASALIPSTRTAAAMYLVPAIANNEDLQAIKDNSLKALRKLSEEWLLKIAEPDQPETFLQKKEL